MINIRAENTSAEIGGCVFFIFYFRSLGTVMIHV